MPQLTAGFSGRLAAAAALQWGSDLFLVRDAANTLALRNGTSAQAYRVYNTFTDASNGEWGMFDFTTNANTLNIGTNANGAGNSRGIRLYVGGTAKLFMGGSDIEPITDNSFDLAAAANRFRNGWFSGFLASSPPVTASGTTYTVAITDADVIFTNAGTCTVTLPAPASFNGRILWIKTTGGGSVVSATSNVVPKAGGAAGTAILAATAGTWARLKSDATNWIVTSGT